MDAAAVAASPVICCAGVGVIVMTCLCGFSPTRSTKIVVVGRYDFAHCAGIGMYTLGDATTMAVPIFHNFSAAPKHVAPFSHAVECEGWVQLTGQMPTDPDDDLKPLLESECQKWLKENNKEFQFEWAEDSGFHVLSGKGSDWAPRVYVQMFTDLFQKGVTRCLVGTRGLLGEGWDANKINVLIDLTSVTTSMSVNQLRGRSFRLDAEVPQKIANNWDVVCIAPEFAKGMDDYKRFKDKHQKLYGVTDDGAIEKGVGHVHASFRGMRIDDVEENMVNLNPVSYTHLTLPTKA